MFKELDYVEKQKQVFVVDQPRSFNAIASGDADLDEFLKGSCRLSDVVKLAGEHYGYTLPVLSGTANVPDKFRAHLKDAMFRPYIAGSSLKGALRTIIFASALRKLPTDTYQHLLPKFDNQRKQATVPAKIAGKKLMENIFGKDPNHDLLRAFHITDTIFQPVDLRLTDIRWLNLVKIGSTLQPQWRDITVRANDEKKQKNFTDWNKAKGVYSEMIAPLSLAPVTLGWDNFLLSNLKWHSDNPLPHLFPASFDELRECLNTHAELCLQREIGFYKHYGQTKPQEECQKILQLLRNESKSAYLQLSWGSGWRGMTGDWMDDDLQNAMRKLYKEMRGRDGMPFPKNRRLAVSGEPRLPLGWVRLIPYAQIEEKLQQRQTEQSAKANRCTWVDSQISQLMQKNKCKENDVLRGSGLAQAWQHLEEGNLKQQALEDIKNRWQKENWWNEPNGKSARQAKAIYEQH